jgi:hypothetical protein
MQILHETFSMTDLSHFRVQVDVSRVPVGDAATIGFSSFGVIDSCTSTTLALVDPLVFRLKTQDDQRD